MPCLRLLGALLALALPVGAARAGRLDPATREARALARQAAPAVQRQLKMMCAPGVKALARLLRDGVVPRELLVALLDNPAAAPHVEQVLIDLTRGQHIPGALRSLDALGKQTGTGSAYGYAFEVRATALLAPYLARVSLMIKGHEVDGELLDGTTIEIKSGWEAPMQAKMLGQVGHSSQGAVPGMVVGARPFEALGWTARGPWDLRHELAARLGREVAVAHVAGDRVVVQIPSRHLGPGVVFPALEATSAPRRPHTPHSRRAQRRVARRAAR